MSGIFDLHAVVVIKRGVALYLADAAKFAGLFRAVEPSVITEWFTELARTGVHVLTGFDQSPPKPPFILVSLTDETPSQSALGDYIGADDDGAELLGYYVSQGVSVGCWTKSAELTRALAIIVRASMLQATRALISAGYESVDYGGMEPLSLEERLIAESGGMALRVLRWDATSIVQVRHLDGAPASITWWVQASDLTVDGEPGGVVPSRP
jgi:hypothetical protein|tara:strand:- start:129 stop:761 length:633 start_codon:yes stop_codon:yes gene_type:complete